MNIREIRTKYPEYDDLSDQQIAEGMHRRYYSDMPFASFAEKIGYEIPGPSQEEQLAKEASPAEAFLVGAGKTLTNAPRGLAGAVSHGMEAIGNITGNQSMVEEQRQARELMRQEQASEQAALSELEAERPGWTMAGQIAPYMVAPAARLSSAMGSGATIGAMETGTAADPGTLALGVGGGAAFGLGGYGLGKGLNRLISGPQPSPAAQEVARRNLQQQGVKFTPAEISGRPVSRRIEASIETLPGGGSGIQRIRESNQALFNRKAAEAIGEQADEVSEGVLGRAAESIGDKFETVTAGKKFQVDVPFVRQINRIEQDFTSLPGRPKKLPRIISDIKKELAESGGSLSGERYQRIVSSLGKQARTAQKESPDLAEALVSVKDALDDLVTRSGGMSPGEKAVFQEARQQWRNLKLLESPGVIREANISPSTLANRLNRETTFRRGMGVGPLEDIRQYGNYFKGSPTSYSGERLSIPVLSGLMGGGTYIAGGDPMTAAAIGAMPWAAGRAYPALGARLAGGLIPRAQGLPIGGLLSRPTIGAGGVALGGLLSGAQ